jgi:hypothetical protein
MRQQSATTVIPIPLVELEDRLSRIESWPDFLMGVESVEKLGYERYRFTLDQDSERREIVVAVRHKPRGHTFTWQSLDGPAFTGRFDLADTDVGDTRVSLTISSHPSTTWSSIADFVLPRMSQADHDLRNLEELVLRAIVEPQESTE